MPRITRIEQDSIDDIYTDETDPHHTIVSLYVNERVELYCSCGANYMGVGLMYLPHNPHPKDPKDPKFYEPVSTGNKPSEKIISYVIAVRRDDTNEVMYLRGIDRVSDIISATLWANADTVLNLVKLYNDHSVATHYFVKQLVTEVFDV